MSINDSLPKAADPLLQRGKLANRLITLNERRKIAAMFGQNKVVIRLTGIIRHLVHINGGLPVGVQIPGVIVEGGMTAYPVQHPSTTSDRGAKMFRQDTSPDSIISARTTQVIPQIRGTEVAATNHDAQKAKSIRDSGKRAKAALKADTLEFNLDWTQKVTAHNLHEALTLMRPVGYGYSETPDAGNLNCTFQNKDGSDVWVFVCTDTKDWCFDLYHNESHIDAAFVIQADKRGTDQQGVPLSFMKQDFNGVITPLEAHNYVKGWAAALNSLRTLASVLARK